MDFVDLAVCPICGGPPRLLRTVPTICPDSSDRPELRRCINCGHWWHSPVPNEASLLELYRSASRYVVGPDAASSLTAHKPAGTFDDFALHIISSVAQARYLEIGAGGGQMMRHVRRMGFECYGVDPGQWTSDPAIKPDLDDWPENLTFRLFLLQDVIEHVVDPIALCRRLRRRAEVNAIAIASFPCCESRPARIYGARWDMVRPYGHIHYFSRRSAMALFEKSGWKVTSVQLARVRAVSQLLTQLNIRALVYELLKGGPDQLHVCASI